MADVMKKGLRYKVDHPLFAGIWIIDGEIYPKGIGRVSKSNGTPNSVEGRMFFAPAPSTFDVPRDWFGKIVVSGMTVVLPDDAGTFPIYLEQDGSPSSREDEQKRYEVDSHRFNDKLESIVNQILGLLGDRASTEARSALTDMLQGLKFTYYRRSCPRKWCN